MKKKVTAEVYMDIKNDYYKKIYAIDLIAMTYGLKISTVKSVIYSKSYEDYLQRRKNIKKVSVKIDKSLKPISISRSSSCSGFDILFVLVLFCIGYFIGWLLVN